MTTPINLALQGGGSHGAFTWGVLDALLEDGSLSFEGVSGTSAGAMNAVALAHGFASVQGGKSDAREAARESLTAFWQNVMQLDPSNSAGAEVWGLMMGGWNLGQGGAASPMKWWADATSRMFSPYQTNPLDLNPLRDMVAKRIDFERIAAAKKSIPQVFVCATAVNTGKAEIFYGKRLTADAVMASACLPKLFQAVEIEGVKYWDGGYSGNPALHPLIYHCASADIVLVQINPIKRDHHPDSAEEIIDRMNELTFNASLLAQVRAIDFVSRMLAEGRLDAKRYKDVRLHRIDGGEAMEALGAHTKTSAHKDLIEKLFALGRECAQRWLKKHFNDIGKRCTVNIARDYLDDMRMDPNAAR